MDTFDIEYPRRGTGSYKWDTPAAEDILPLWVADMDFQTAPPVIEALRRRVEHGIFGYAKVPTAYYEAIDSWFSRRHGLHIPADDIIYTTGVVPAISAIIKALTRPGDGVILQTPVYNCFFSSIRNNGCRTIDNALRLAPDGTYSIDYDGLERHAADPRNKLLLLCNPHNPAGRLWTPDELQRLARLCRDNGVTVVADEIHCEFTYGTPYTPFATVAQQEQCPFLMCFSPSKAFNIAGLQIANIYTPDAALRYAVDRAINDNEVCDVGPFGIDALIAAYTRGEPWLNGLNAYLHDNYLAARQCFDTFMPQYRVTPLEATYLLWVDISVSGLDADTFCQRLERQQRVLLSPGTIYGDSRFVRINLATQRSRLLDALQRLAHFRP